MMFMGHKVIVDSEVPESFRVGPNVIFVTPQECFDLAMMEPATVTAVIERMNQYDLSRLQAET